MRVGQLDQLYKESISRFKEQMRKQEKDRMEILRRQVREEQKLVYERKMQEEREARRRELRLVQEELDRITEQSVHLKEQIEALLEGRHA